MQAMLLSPAIASRDMPVRSVAAWSVFLAWPRLPPTGTPQQCPARCETRTEERSDAGTHDARPEPGNSGQAEDP